MARQKTIILGALNIVVSPHPEGVYADMIQAMRGKRIHARGPEWATIGTMISAEKRNLPHLWYGKIYFYTEIELGGAWLDLKARDVASAEAVEEINIPDNLRPNMKSMRYIFDTKKHTFYFEAKNEAGERFPAGKVKAIIEKLAKTISDKFPEVRVTVIPHHDAIEKVLNIPRMTRIFIKLERPNPDDIGTATRKLLKELEDQGASRQEISLTKSKSADSLELNEENTEIAEVAAQNGYVRSEGTDLDGKKMAAQTTDYPREEFVPLEDGADAMDVLFAFIRDRHGV